MIPKLIQGNLFTDDRGTVRFVNDFDLYSAGIRRFYQVENHQVNYIRAWHCHLNENKYVYVNKGTALIGACSLEKNTTTDTYYLNEGSVSKFILSETLPKVLFIPKGYGNGFKTLEPGTIITFYSTSTLEESKGDDIRFAHDIVDIWKEDYR